MKIATWNVNSIKVRLPQLVDWLNREHPDVVCLQETKVEDAAFPAAELADQGYRSVVFGQKAYNGVAILSRDPVSDCQLGMAGFPDEQKRVAIATIRNMRIVCAYVPNGQSLDSDKYVYKLEWLSAFRDCLRTELESHDRLAVLGDYNIAPTGHDVHDPVAWEGQVLCSPQEREAFEALRALGLHDSFRLFEQPERSFTWWDYRMNAFRRKMGLRIDHILLSDALARVCTSCRVDTAMRALERPSDHAPVIAEITET
ncbi:MAG: exodeoxyribonuclease III [Betaproteobacteria bacterium]|jgi:exodeoxyribonuclease-3